MTTPTSNSSEAALPAALLDAHPAQWRLVGKGLFTWSVFRLYHAYLYAPAASASTPFNLDGDFALMLRYLRNIPGEQIVTTSTQEIARLTNTSAASLAEWTESMTRIFPDVASGDRLTGLFLRGQGVGFYSGDTLAGEIDSPAFARAFAAIWLDPRTRSPALRAGLLGL